MIFLFQLPQWEGLGTPAISPKSRRVFDYSQFIVHTTVKECIQTKTAHNSVLNGSQEIIWAQITCHSHILSNDLLLLFHFKDLLLLLHICKRQQLSPSVHELSHIAASEGLSEIPTHTNVKRPLLLLGSVFHDPNLFLFILFIFVASSWLSSYQY